MCYDKIRKCDCIKNIINPFNTGYAYFHKQHPILNELIMGNRFYIFTYSRNTVSVRFPNLVRGDVLPPVMADSMAAQVDIRASQIQGMLGLWLWW